VIQDVAAPVCDEQVVETVVVVVGDANGWGAGMIDLDNDGLPDLFLVTGSVYPELEKKLPDYRSARRASSSETWAMASARSWSTGPAPGLQRRTPAAGARSAISTTMAT